MDLNVTTETFGADKMDWLASAHGAWETARTITLDGADLVAVYTDGNVPSGVPIGKVNATGRYKIYNNAASDGSDVLVGFLLTPQKVKGRDGATINPSGPLMRHGQVVEAKLPASWVAGGAAATVGKADVAQRIDFV